MSDAEALEQKETEVRERLRETRYKFYYSPPTNDGALEDFLITELAKALVRLDRLEAKCST